MATTVTFNGSTYNIPANREPRGWGLSLSSFLVDVANSSLSKAGGTFTLTADANFGATYGLVVKYLKSSSSNIAATGVVRFANNEGVVWRNAANSADLELKVDAGNRLEFNAVDLVTVSSTDTLTNKTLTSPVINTPTGIVKGDVGLGNVDNTSDANKPVSSAQQTALNLKANIASPTFTGTVGGITASMVGLGNVDNTSNATERAATATLSNKTLDTPIIDNGATFLHETTPSTPSSGRVRVYPKSDNSLYILDSSGIETPVGSGTAAGFINYITNPDALTGTTGWATYADAAAATPADGTGGAPNVTWTRNTTTPLRGTGDFAFAKDAANRQGQGVSFAFTIATTDRGKKHQISFDYDTVKTNYAAGDLRVYIYDVTNATLITPPVVDVPRATSTFYTTFDASTSTSYRLILHVALGNPLAYTVNLDNFIVNANPPEQGAAVGEWQNFTLSTSLVNEGTLSNTFAQYRSVGSDMEVRFSTEMTNPSGMVTFNPPVGTLDTSRVGSAASTDTVLGTLKILDVGITTYLGSVVYSPGTGIRFFCNTTGYVSAGSPVVWAGTDNWSAEFRIPIAEWAGNSTVNLGRGAQVEYAFNNSATTSTDTTSFGYGSAGFAFQSFAPAGTASIAKRVRFQYPIQTDDEIMFEVRDNGAATNPWLGSAVVGIALTSAGTAGSPSNYYGVTITRVAGSSTDINVDFYSGAYSGVAWSGFSGFNWRVRKAKASSPVGFGKADSLSFGLVAPRKGQTALTFSGTPAGWSLIRANGIYYQDQDGNHRLKFYISATVTSTTSSTVTIVGVTFKNVAGFNQPLSAATASTVAWNCYTGVNNGNVSLDTASSQANFKIAGDVELESRPTWA